MFLLDVYDHVALLVTLLRTVGTMEHRLFATLQPAMHGQTAAVFIPLTALWTLPAGVLGPCPSVGAATLEFGRRVDVIVVVEGFGVGGRRRDEVGHVIDVDVLLPRGEDLMLVVEELGDDLTALVLGHHRGVSC